MARRRLMQKVVIGLAVIYVLTFLSGFLQDTQFNFVNYIFFSLFFIGGTVLMSLTLKSDTTGVTRAIVLLTGIVTTLLSAFFVAYEWSRLKGHHNLEGSIEGFLYLATLAFWILVVVSLVLIRRKGGGNSI